ncbi:unnamed protein product [Meloidogyne enterolobii]|uniref:Uncharacterized protein n=1 Tax=Meloidogyne enterolobii TaxID=390850 RepID=A0ACB0ZLB9_MELEN
MPTFITIRCLSATCCTVTVLIAPGPLFFNWSHLMGFPRLCLITGSDLLNFNFKYFNSLLAYSVHALVFFYFIFLFLKNPKNYCFLIFFS